MQALQYNLSFDFLRLKGLPNWSVTMSSKVKFQVGKLKFEIKIQPRYLSLDWNDLNILVRILHRIYVVAQRINARLIPCQKMCRFITFFVNHYYE